LFCRDVPGWAIYFGAYEFFKTKFEIPNSEFLTMRQMIEKMCCGGLAGMASWFVTYPFDTVKTIM
jgi:hypothetical protein